MVDDPVLRLALASHTQTIKALMDYVDGTEAVLPAFVRDEPACAITRWMGTEGAAFADLPAYVRAKAIHDEFHGAVTEIVKLVDDGNRADALRKLRAGSPFARLSRRMITAFEELAEAVRNASTSN